MVTLFACLFCATALAQRFHKHLSSAQREHILDGPFAVIEALPARVKQAFAEITAEHSFALANPGQKYQVADVVSEPGLPLRRLLFAGVTDDEWFIHDERGGRGHGYYVVLFKVDAQQSLQFLWGGAGFRGAKNLEELRKMVTAGQFSDDSVFSW